MATLTDSGYLLQAAEILVTKIDLILGFVDGSLLRRHLVTRRTDTAVSV